MPIRKLKPTSNGHRNMSVMTYSEITKKAPEKSLTTDLRKSGGRNNTGRITYRRDYFIWKCQEISERTFRRKKDPKYIQMEIRNRHFEERKRYSIFSNDRYTKRSGTGWKC